MAGVLEEGVKGAAQVAGGVVDAMRGSPMALAMGLMNVALLLFLFYYLTRITARTEHTLELLFSANDKQFSQWAGIIKDTNTLTEKAMHCLLPEDAIKLLTIPPRFEAPARPAPPQRPRQ